MHYSKIKYHAKHFGRLRAVLSALVLFLGVIIRMVMWTLMRPIVAILKPRNYEFTVKKLRNYTAVFGWYLRKGLRFACTLGPAHFQDGNLE